MNRRSFLGMLCALPVIGPLLSIRGEQPLQYRIRFFKSREKVKLFGPAIYSDPGHRHSHGIAATGSQHSHSVAWVYLEI